MNLRKMNRIELDLRLKKLAKEEREILHEILLTIREIDGRKIFLEMGFASLFEYLTQGIGYSNAGAQRRIDAARLMLEIPELGEKIQTGELKLNQISMVQKAARDVAKFQEKKVTAVEKAVLLQMLSNKTIQQSQKEIATFFDIPVEQRTEKKVQADESVRIELTLSKEIYEKLQRAQALLSSSVNSHDLVQFIEFVSDKVIQQKTLVKQARAMETNQPESVTESDDKNETKAKNVIKKTRTVLPARTFSVPKWKKQVHAKQHRCQYRDPITGKVCNSQWFLQVDHKQPRWADGSNDQSNLQILCSGHNQLKYRQEAMIKFQNNKLF